MSQECRSFIRPKVRFCEDDGQKLLEEITAANTNKPQITSVVTIDKPIKIVRPDCSARIQNEHHSDGKLTDATECGQLRHSALLNKTCQEPTIPNLIETNKTELLNGTNAGTRSTSNQESGKSTNIHSREINIHGPPIILSERQDTDLQKTSGSFEPPTLLKQPVIQQGKSTKLKNDTKSKVQKGKENKGPNKGKTLLSQPVKGIKSKSSSQAKVTNIVSKNASSASTTALKATKNSSVIKSVSKNQSTKSAIGVMPCHKYKKTVAKVSPVKKLLVRDIIGKDIKPCVGPGTIHKKPLSEPNKLKCSRSSISSEKLSKPEYNSIMCTIKKLNEVKKEKVVSDMEHLPSPYKDLMNRKISATLDFPFEETVFRNLVDLSIDENQFTSRVMRSKDPEPRQKDIVPKLSDFFIPESLEEYCVPVSVKPRVPEMQNNWNAFRIHEKILHWEESMDNEN